MASKMLRRSGVAVGLIVELLDHWKADYIYQVGVGQYHEEMTVLKEEWPEVQITGFEAHPHIVRARKKDYPGKLVHKALSDKPGTVTIYTRKRHKDGTSLHPFIQQENQSYGEMEAPCSTLDATYPTGPEGSCVLLWLDCEGSELAVLRGGEHFVRDVQVINVEMTANPTGLGWGSPGNTHHWLVDHGFLRQWIHTQRSSAGQYDAVYVRREMWDGRYCCDPYPI